jgi:hypothetical protein
MRKAAKWLLITGFVLIIPAAAFLYAGTQVTGMSGGRRDMLRKIGYGFVGTAFVSYAAGRVIYFGLLYRKNREGS